jgi:hypothetical protein
VSASARRPPLAGAPYRRVCVPVRAGWIPVLLHGPIAEKFNVLYIQGSIAVWGFYAARCSIGFWVAITVMPRSWYLRGPLCGFLALLPLSIVSLAMPGCGFT